MELAEKCLNYFVELYPGDVIFYQMFGEALTKNDKIKRIRAIFEKGLSRNEFQKRQEFWLPYAKFFEDKK